MSNVVTLEAMVRRMSRVAEEMFDETGFVDSCWLVDIPGEGQKLIVSPLVVPPGMRPGKAKTMLADAMRELFEQLGVTRYVYAAEAWVGGGKIGTKQKDEADKWIAEHGSLANYPGRRECIAINADDGEQVLCAMRTIVRPANGKPYLTKLEIEQSPMQVGRFIGLLSGPRLKETSELPDDEGTVYMTAVADAPFQIFGRRARNGELYVGATFTPDEGHNAHECVLKGAEQCRAETGVEIEVVTGLEAEKLIAAVVKAKARVQ
jgi:hypothetical protein